MPSNREIGQLGENLACEYLEKLGYKILERNKHFSRACELDIIAISKNKTLVAVEVKTRSSEVCGTGFEAITPVKYKNIRQGLFTYLSQNLQYKKFQIDVISIILKPEVSITHLKNV